MIYAIITFLIAILIGSVLISKGDITGTWSDVITKYDAKFPNEAGSFTSQLIPSNLYNQITLPSAIIHTIILMAAYMFLLAMVIYFSNLSIFSHLDFLQLFLL